MAYGVPAKPAGTPEDCHLPADSGFRQSDPAGRLEGGTNSRLVAGYLLASRLIALLPLLVGCAVLVGGWLLDHPTLRSVLPYAATMKANTALCVIFAAAALLLETGRTTTPIRLAARLCAAVPLLIGGLTLIEYVSGSKFGIDELLFRDAATVPSAMPGRPSAVAATSFALMGAAFLCRRSRGRILLLGQCLILAVAFLSLASLIGYLYGIRNFAGIGFYTGIAVHTSASLLLLCASSLLAVPDCGLMRVLSSRWVGGQMARRLLPLAIVIPVALGWLTHEGQLAGIHNLTFGLALLTTANVVCFTLLIWLSGSRLNSSDLGREMALQKLFESQRQAAEARAEERFRLSFEQAPVGMALIDPDGAWRRVNRSLCELTGYSEQEMIALNHGITHPDDLEDTRRLVNRMKAGKILSCALEKRYVHKTGRVLHVLVTVSAWQDEQGKTAGFVAHMLDMTERKLAEKAYRESEARFRNLLESAPDAMVIVDESGRIVLVNSQTERLFGYGRDELLGAPLETLLPPRFRGAHVSHRAAYFAAKKSRPMGAQLELYGLHKDGREIPVEIGLSPLQMGNDVWVSSSIRDITERKRLAMELESSRLQAAGTARLSALGEMAAGIAHEVNNPLAVVSASAANLLRLTERGNVGGEELRKHVDRIVLTSDRIAKIVRSLRHIARDDSEEDFREVSVREILDECLELCGERFRVHSIRLTGPDIPHGVSISCREAQIGQVLLNLLQNAFDAVVDHSGEKWVRLDASVRDRRVVLSVTDSGPGIPPELRPRIMEPFFTTKPPGKGTGLGLSLSCNIAAAHGGRLELDQEPGHTCFRLTLPVADQGDER